MSQKGSSTLGVILFLLLALAGIFYGSYLFKGVLGNSQGVITDNWERIDGRTLTFIHPKDWQVQEKDNGDGSEEYVVNGISCLSPLNQKVTAKILYYPTAITEGSLCNDEAKKYASEFRYLSGKRSGYKCVFKNYKPISGGSGETTAYIYTFLDEQETSMVVVDVRAPKWSLPDPVLEKKLDAIVNSIHFTF